MSYVTFCLSDPIIHTHAENRWDIWTSDILLNDMCTDIWRLTASNVNLQRLQGMLSEVWESSFTHSCF